MHLPIFIYNLGRTHLALLVEQEAIARLSSVVQTRESIVSVMGNWIVISNWKYQNILKYLSPSVECRIQYILVYVDSSDQCNDLSFNLGGTASGVTELATRKWSIKVWQSHGYVSMMVLLLLTFFGNCPWNWNFIVNFLFITDHTI